MKIFSTCCLFAFFISFLIGGYVAGEAFGIVILPNAKFSAYGPRRERIIFLTFREEEAWADTVQVESCGEPLEGQVAVAASMINRYLRPEHRKYKDLVDVVDAKGQYSNRHKANPAKRAQFIKVVRMVEFGWDPTRKQFPDGARHFYNAEKTSQRELLIRRTVDKLVLYNHTFHDEFDEPSLLQNLEQKARSTKTMEKQQPKKAKTHQQKKRKHQKKPQTKQKRKK